MSHASLRCAGKVERTRIEPCPTSNPCVNDKREHCCTSCAPSCPAVEIALILVTVSFRCCQITCVSNICLALHAYTNAADASPISPIKQVLTNALCELDSRRDEALRTQDLQQAYQAELSQPLRSLIWLRIAAQITSRNLTPICRQLCQASKLTKVGELI